MTTPVNCPTCGILSMKPCTDLTTAAQCPIYQARQAAAAQPQGPMIDVNPNTPATAAETAVAPPVFVTNTPRAGETAEQTAARSPEAREMLRQAAQITAPPAHPQVIADKDTGTDAINPSYYARFAIQPIKFIRDNNLTFWQGNVVKYVCRADAKNGLEDIEKALNYLLKERAYLKGDPNWHMAELPVA